MNTVDDEKEPTDYVYVPKNCFTADIEVDCKVTTIQSCICEDKCDSSCCTCGRNSVHCWYDTDGKLLLDFNYSGEFFYERDYSTVKFLSNTTQSNRYFNALY